MDLHTCKQKFMPFNNISVYKDKNCMIAGSSTILVVFLILILGQDRHAIYMELSTGSLEKLGLAGQTRLGIVQAAGPFYLALAGWTRVSITGHNVFLDTLYKHVCPRDPDQRVPFSTAERISSSLKRICSTDNSKTDYSKTKDGRLCQKCHTTRTDVGTCVCNVLFVLFTSIIPSLDNIPCTYSYTSHVNSCVCVCTWRLNTGSPTSQLFVYLLA